MHLNDQFKQPEIVEEAANKLFKGDGAAGKKIQSEIESIDTSKVNPALGELIDHMKQLLLENWQLQNIASGQIQLVRRTSTDLMAEYKKNFEWKNIGDNSAEISEDPDACLIKVPGSGQQKQIVVSEGPDSYNAEAFWKNVWDQNVKLINCLVDYGQGRQTYFSN